MFSFYSDDSYEPLPCGPDACVTRKKPLIVPSLNLDNLPEYETSSDEEEDGGDGAGDGGEDHKGAGAGAGGNDSSSILINKNMNT